MDELSSCARSRPRHALGWAAVCGLVMAVAALWPASAAEVSYPSGVGPIRVLYAQITAPGPDLAILDFRKIPRSTWGRWDLFLYDFPSGRTTRLTDAALANLYPFGNYFYPAALSPDGRRVAFGGAALWDILFAPSWALMPFTHIWTLDVATRKMLRLSKPPNPAVKRKFRESIQVPGQFRRIVWSPDGRQVAADQDVGNPDLMHAGDGGAWCVWEAASAKWLSPPDKAFSEAAKRWRGEHGLRSRSWRGEWVASWDYSSTLHMKNTHTGRSWTAAEPRRSHFQDHSRTNPV